MSSWIIAHLWLIPFVPLIASLAIVSLPGSSRALAATTAILSQMIALAFSVGAFIATLQTPGFRSFQNFTWFTFGDQPLRIGFVLDPLTAAMLLMITAVALCIFIFSIGYMSGDKNFVRFFAYLSFFTFAMLGVVVANSLLLLFICWELVGLASYLLIGFWIERPAAAAAAKKAFITTRIGDIGFFLGLLWLYRNSGTLLFYDGGHGSLERVALGTSATAIALLIFCGAVGKSGQFPLHVWLPDAMEGPTPVSALIHAATMVAAGVFLVARVYPIFLAGADHGVTTSLTVVVWVGVITAVMAALIAIAQFDIKRILAYSTVSQLGLMMVSLGVGGVAAGVLHLIAHAFFKALLFLGAGSAIHGLHHEQDIRRMGGLRGVMPVTFATYAVGMMALSGVPLFFAGAWTKEEILHATSTWTVSRVPHYLMMLGVILTAFYMTRQMLYVFAGKRRHAALYAYESPRVMTFPLVLLAIATVLLSIILTPAWPWLHSYLLDETATLDLGRLISPMLFVSLVLVAVGIGAAVLLYRGVAATDPLESQQPAVFRFLNNRMWFDELYGRTVVRLSQTAAIISDLLDRYFWDGLVRAVGTLGRSVAATTSSLDERGINGGVDELTITARALGQVTALAHSGKVQNYLGIVGLGMLGLLLIYAWLT
ncbi:MAG: NADH-quinone oxidoreductase subunit L [Chthoniobacterales bacterium]